jgi:SAM-dependent methyltransferase
LKDNYKNVSLIYDEFICARIDYKFWAKYLYETIKQYCVCNKCSVLELAAGNCSLAKYLYKKFPYYLVSDLSISMLRKCKINSIHKVCFDMLRIPLKKRFEIVLCTFDSVNYILSKKKLKEFFTGVRDVLTEDGIFLFDVGLIKNSLHHQLYSKKQGRVGEVEIERESIFLNKSKIHKNIFYIKLENGKKVKEIHRQKIYELYELFDIIEQSKLYVAECFDAFTFNDCKPNNFRAQFVVKRN